MFNTPYLNDYLAMVEDTESPRIFHVWNAIYAISCALGRRCWFEFGPTVIWPNQYVLIVGTPGTRKSTAASLMKRQLSAATGVRFAPGDTAGQRQGLIKALANTGEQKEFLESALLNGRDDSMMALTLDEISEVTNVPDSLEAAFISVADKHHMAVVASEFSQFIGQNQNQLLDFLTQMWDGDDYSYQTKSGDTDLKNPLLNIIGCTTPSSIAASMPSAVVGQGFLSRMILVYGAKKYKSVPRPASLNPELVQSIQDTLNNVYYNCNGVFTESEEAREYSIGLYDYTLEISDSRFGYYNERRYTHLIKLAMALCASRGDSMEISRADYDEANRILRATERGMPDALGEFGMNPLASVKQAMLEHIRTNAFVEVPSLQASFHRDAKATEITDALNDLHRSGQVRIVQGVNGLMTVHAVLHKSDTEDAMLKLLSGQ